MTFTRMQGLTLLVLLAMVGMAAWFYPELPDPVPTHWNAAGEIDDAGFGSSLVTTMSMKGSFLSPADLAELNALYEDLSEEENEESKKSI